MKIAKRIFRIDIIIIRKKSSSKWECMNYKNIFLHFDRAIKTYNIHMIMKNRKNIFIYKINKVGKKKP
jgi:hypothetical protein